jgi:glycogenin glucosyltransferase
MLEVFHVTVPVDPLTSLSQQNLELLGRPDLAATFTKFHAWTLTQYTKIVFMDADVLPLVNVDDLFSFPDFAACADIGWPDCFNSGVFVAVPNVDTFHRLVELGQSQGSFDGKFILKLRFHKFVRWRSGSVE